MPESVIVGCINVFHNAIDCSQSDLPLEKWCDVCYSKAEQMPSVFLIKKGKRFVSLEGLKKICQRLNLPELSMEDAWRFRADVPPRVLSLRQFYVLRSNVRTAEAA